MIKLYLDIDGVLLTKNLEVPASAKELIHFVIDHFDCYWLTTHCKGDATTAIRYLSNYYPNEYIKKLKQIKPTTWDTLKTDAIDYSNDFYWIDDFPFEAEKMVLESNRVLNRLIVVDLKQSSALAYLLAQLKAYVAIT